MAPVITIQGKDYDIDRDFTWAELVLIEELAGVPLGRRGALESMTVVGAFVFAILKRKNESLTWEEFLKQPMDIFAEDDKEPSRRPTKAKAAA